MRVYCALRTVLDTGKTSVRMINIIPSIMDLIFQGRRQPTSKYTWRIIGQMINFIRRIKHIAKKSKVERIQESYF